MDESNWSHNTLVPLPEKKEINSLILLHEALIGNEKCVANLKLNVESKLPT
jgi:hypothetical protein